MKRTINSFSTFALLSLSALVGCDTGSTALNGGPMPSTPDAAVDVTQDSAPVVQPRTVPAGRVTDTLQALYIFDGGAELSEILDYAPGENDELLADPYNLTIDNLEAVTFGPDGMTITEPMLATNPEPNLALIQSCQNNSSITIEAWAKSDVLVPEERGRLVSMSPDTGNRNFDIANNEEGRWDARLRTVDTGNNGANPSTPGALESVSGDMQHILYTRIAGLTNRGTIHVDGVKSGLDQNITGSFANWNLDYALNVGNEATGDRPFIGTIALIAVYCRALTPEEITQNYEAGYL